ncbi:hypothetical protein B0I71DRAFT_134496 [Yarrowia lipolytica]|uniref:Uncharacterized protein n=1 Tax=Yarrowia lipolytica TaxID=4952 RepID=A0A371C2F8_YARLL|nr:hypothetical protein B0I71DRAFT_134496 [Yarrowia lipolytica]
MAYKHEEKDPILVPELDTTNQKPALGFAILLSDYLDSCDQPENKVSIVHSNSPFGSYLDDTNGITVRTDIARSWAKMEMTAIKNRIVLSGLTLTIPLFMYLKLIFW